jgi:hypothetical protein
MATNTKSDTGDGARVPWASIPADDKLAMLRQAIVSFHEGRDAEILEVKPGFAITVALHEVRTIAQEGHLLMALEEHIRKHVGAPVELFFQQRIDQNKLRADRERMMDWLKRRQRAKKKGDEGG